MLIQRRKEGEEKWQTVRCGLTLGVLEPGYEYRANQLIEQAPKWPQTTMPPEAMSALHHNDPTHTDLWKFANGVIEHECSTGALVPADKVREIEAKAREAGVKQERDRNLRMTRHVYVGGFYK